MADATVDLITVDEFLTATGQDDANPNFKQGQTEFLITAASQQMINLADGRKFIQAEDTMEFLGNGSLKQQVRYPPIDDDVGNVPVISYWNGTAWVVAEVGPWPRQFQYDVGKVIMTSAVFTKNIRWKIVYTGGYLQAAILNDVKMAVVQLVQRAQYRADGREGLKSESMENQTTSYDLATLATNAIKVVAERQKVIYTL